MHFLSGLRSTKNTIYHPKPICLPKPRLYKSTLHSSSTPATLYRPQLFSHSHSQLTSYSYLLLLLLSLQAITVTHLSSKDLLVLEECSYQDCITGLYLTDPVQPGLFYYQLCHLVTARYCRSCSTNSDVINRLSKARVFSS